MFIESGIHRKPLVTGSFDSAGCPTIDIEISGPLGHKHQFTAMVDTGFSGFLLLPILSAFPVGLLLQGTMRITLADGSTQTKLTCLGSIHFDGKEDVGVIVIEPQNTQVLVGMEFLRIFNLRLTVEPNSGIVEIVAGTPIPTAPPPAPETPNIPPAQN